MRRVELVNPRGEISADQVLALSLFAFIIMKLIGRVDRCLLRLEWSISWARLGNIDRFVYVAWLCFTSAVALAPNYVGFTTL